MAKEHELKKRIADKTKILKAMAAKVEAEDRDWTPEEQEDFDGVKADIEGLKTRLEKLEGVTDEDDVASDDEGDDDEMVASGRSSRKVAKRSAPAIHGTKTHNYSITRAVCRILENKPVDGLEAEVHQEMERQSGKKARGLLVPHDFGRSFEKRTTVNLTTGAGAIPTLVEDSLIEYLYNRTEVIKAGATVITDMTNKFALPRQSGTATAQWVGEGSSPAVSNQTIDQVVFTPKTIAAYVDLTRKFIMQSVVNAEQMARADLSRQVALGIDYAALNGNPNSNANQPLGLFQNNSIAAVTLLGANGGAPTFAALVDLETLVAKGNADLGSMSYMTSAVGRGTLKTTVKNTGTGYPIYLMENGEANGYPVNVTNQILDSFTEGSGSSLTGLVFGNWNDLVISMFGPLDILVDPYTGSNAGTVRINIFQDADIAVRHNQSFSTLLFTGNQ